MKAAHPTGAGADVFGSLCFEIISTRDPSMRVQFRLPPRVCRLQGLPLAGQIRDDLEEPPRVDRLRQVPLVPGPECAPAVAVARVGRQRDRRHRVTARVTKRRLAYRRRHGGMI